MPKIFFSFILFLLMFSVSLAQETGRVPEFSKEDRILILAPHPDDEAIATSGIIQRALKHGIPLRVTYLTNGDHNQVAFVVYKKRPILRTNQFIKMGEIRRREATSAMEFLGLKESQLTFLGYPDFETLRIFKEYWGDTKPLSSRLTRISRVPYKECFSYNAPYTGDSVLRDLKIVLLEFSPTKIFVSLPVDKNVDHRALYLFLKVALWDLKGKIPEPKLYPYVVHVSGWPRPRGRHTDLELLPPERLKDSSIHWMKLGLSDEEVQNKVKAISFYRSQIEYKPSFLYTFARKNELFGSYPPITLEDHKDRPIVWSSIEHADKIKSQEISEEDEDEQIIDSLGYARKNDFLYVLVKLRRFRGKSRGLNLYLIGYKEGVPFFKMPKIRIHWRWKNVFKIFDKRSSIRVDGADLTLAGRELIIGFPLAGLDDPDYILSCAETRAGDLPLEATAWQVLKIKKEKK